MGVLESYLAGREARRVETENQRVNAMQSFMQENGQAIFNGDPNALGQVAQYDVGLAMQLRGMQADEARAAAADQRAAKAESRADQTWEMQLQEWAATKTAEEKAAAAAQIEGAVKTGLALPDAASWDAYMQQNSPDLVGQFDQREAIANQYLSMAEVLKQNEPRAPLSKAGKLQADIDAGIIPAGTQETPDTVVNLGGSEKQIYETMGLSADSARSAITGLNALAEASKAVEAGIISGFGANTRLEAAKLGALAGITDPAIIQNTETFRSAIAPQVAALMKATVGSTQISNADREFAEKAAGGSIALDDGTIKRLLGIMEKASKVVVDTHMSKLDAVYPDNGQFERERALFGVTVPTTETPEVGGLSPEAQEALRLYGSP